MHPVGPGLGHLWTGSHKTLPRHPDGDLTPTPPVRGRLRYRAVRPMVLGFVIFWVVLGVAVVLIAMRGGSREQTPGESRAAERVTLLVIIVLFAFGIAVPALVLASNAKNKAATAPGGVTLSAQQQHGRYLFGQACQVCHTLRASQAVGRVGPNLDILRPPYPLVLNAIEMGRYRGNGDMPALLYTGADARAVASYVAAVAGR